MKQIHLSWLLMAAAVITACEKERIEVEPIVEEPIENATENVPYVYSVKATIFSEEGTRTDYDADGKFSWTSGDKISVLFHNDEGNKFFTLSTEAGGETATFTGTIDAGYTIGAKDGTAEDAKIWALYPASENHQYEDGAMPSFYVQPSVDFTETGFSANIPMYDLLTEEGAFSFKNLASTYKFIVKDLDPAVEKVKFVVYNQLTYGLSGLWPIEKNGSDIFIDYNWASPGSENSTLTFISPVTDGKAVFYVPTRYWGHFQPVIRIYDVDSDELLKEVTAGKSVQPTSFTKVPRIVISASSEPKEAVIEAEDVAVKVGKSVAIGATTNSSATIEYVSGDTGIATVSEDGTVTGVAVGTTTITLSVPAVEGKYTAASKTINVTVSEASASIIDIDGDMSDWESISPTYASEATSRVREWKYVSDADNLYFYIVLRKNRTSDTPLTIGFDWDESGTYSDGNNMKNCELIVSGHPFTNAEKAEPIGVKGFDPNGKINGTADASVMYVWDYDDGSSISSDSSNHYLEVSIPRSKLTNLPAVGTTINIGVSYNYYFAGFQSITLQ